MFSQRIFRVVLWVLSPYVYIVWHWYFEGTCFLHIPYWQNRINCENGGNLFLLYVSVYDTETQKTTIQMSRLAYFFRRVSMRRDTVVNFFKENLTCSEKLGLLSWLKLNYTTSASLFFVQNRTVRVFSKKLLECTLTKTLKLLLAYTRTGINASVMSLSFCLQQICRFTNRGTSSSRGISLLSFKVSQCTILGILRKEKNS